MSLNANLPDVLRGYNAMVTVLDQKLNHMPEWQAFLLMHRMLMETLPVPWNKSPANGAGESLRNETSIRRRRLRVRPITRRSYGDLGVQAVQQAGKPVPTTEIVSFIASQRNADVATIKPNVQAALSRDPRLQSVAWAGIRGWWFADREVPK
jgi:hypothetical protein